MELVIVISHSTIKNHHFPAPFPTKKTDNENVGDVIESDREDKSSTSITSYTYRIADCK